MLRLVELVHRSSSSSLPCRRICTCEAATGDWLALPPLAYSGSAAALNGEVASLTSSFSGSIGDLDMDLLLVGSHHR